MGLIAEDITADIIGAAINVHKELGPGMLESAYEVCLHHELSNCGRTALRQVELPIVYQDKQLDAGYRIDLLVEETVIVELKAVETLEPIHEAQLMTYLRLSGKRVGLLINFNVLKLRDGIVRRVL